MKDFKTYIVITTALLAIFLTGCGGGETVKPPAASPSETFKQYVSAYDRKDVAALKQTFSKGTIKMYENVAQRQRISPDEALESQFDAPLLGDLKSQVEIVSEKIDGDTAIVEIKSKGKENEKIPLVREDGMWKLALDKYAETVIKKMNEDMNRTPTAPANK